MHKTADFTQLDYIHAAVFVLEVSDNGDPVYVAFNRFACDVANRPLSDFLGRTAFEVYPLAYGRTAYERHCEVARSGAVMTYELDLPLGGMTRSIRTTLVPRKDPDGAVQYLYGSSTDITEGRSAQQAQVQLETLMAEREQFVTIAAHDLRAPMRNVAALAEMLLEDFVDHGDGKADLITMLEDVARKTMTLISDVLSHARATNPSENTASTFNFTALCRDICDVLDPQSLHRVTVTPAQLYTDRTALQIVLRNLLDNAIKHGGRDCLDLNIDVTSAPHGMLEVTLTDNGSGFSDPAIVFLAGGAFKPDSGYGLLGVRRLIAARGGSISAENGAVAGAIVHFSLPGEWRGDTASLGDPAGPVDGHH